MIEHGGQKSKTLQCECEGNGLVAEDEVPWAVCGPSDGSPQRRAEQSSIIWVGGTVPLKNVDLGSVQAGPPPRQLWGPASLVSIGSVST